MITILSEYKNTYGNLLFDNRNDERKQAIKVVCDQLTSIGWFCSLFPEGDGFAFSSNTKRRGPRDRTFWEFDDECDVICEYLDAQPSLKDDFVVMKHYSTNN